MRADMGAKAAPGNSALGEWLQWTASALLQHPLLKDLGDMQAFAASPLLDHFAAAEAIGEDDRVRSRFANRGKQDSFADRLRDVVRFRSESERAGHPAASLRRPIDIEAQSIEKLQFRLETDHGMVVTMRLEQRFPPLPRLREAVEIA